MQFQIPQFIEVEDKIAGPFNLKQLLYLVGTATVIGISFALLPIFAALFIAIILVALFIALTFGSYQGMSLVKILPAAFMFLWKPKVYLWKRELIEKVFEYNEVKTEAEVKEKAEQVITQRKALKEFSIEAPSIKKLWNDLTTTKNPIPKREKAIAKNYVDQIYQEFRKPTGEKELAKRIDYR